MQMTETNLPPLSSLPLPAAALVIDMRGERDDGIMERLKIEIGDLTSDMKIHELHHWHYLADFLSFLPKELCPKLMSPEEVDTFRLQNEPTVTIKRDIGNIINEIDSVRSNHRIAETGPGGNTDKRSRQDTNKVRAIFLTDAEFPSSLATTAAYAAYLKGNYREHKNDRQYSMINTTVLCLNNSGEGVIPSTLKELLWNDRWDHLDALIIIDSSHNGVQIARPIQLYLAELLLYILLLVPPLEISSPAPDSQTSLFRSQNMKHATKGQWINLPPKTYSVALASIEHSSRWGRRLLNYKVVEQIVQVIQGDIKRENPSAENAAKSWVEDKRTVVKDAVPDQIPGNLRTLKEAISRANSVIQRPGKVLTAHTFGVIIGQRVVPNLREYLTEIVRTYISSPRPEGQASARTPTLQDGVNTIPLLLQHLSEWENEDPDMKKGTPLFKVEIEAQRVLSHPVFFVGASGAVSRGKLDLKELSNAITQLESEHRQKPIDLLDKQQKLERDANNKLETLQDHIERFPYLGSVLRLKQHMAWLTLFLTFCLCSIAAFVCIAWLRHLITYWSANGSPLPMSTIDKIMDSLLLVSVSPAAFVFWGILLIILLGSVFFFGRRLLDQKSSALAVEGLLCLFLTAFAIIEVIIKPSIARLITDTPSVAIISWLSFLPFWSTIISISILVIIIAIEVSYFMWWYYQLQKEGRHIVSKINTQHKINVEDVVAYISDSILLQMLSDAELTGGEGNPGEYYNRIDQLDTLLTNVLKHSQKQQKVAWERLTRTVNEEQRNVATKRLSLAFREELLKRDLLADGYIRLMKNWKQRKEVKEFSELLLRIMGKETPVEVEQFFKARSAQQENPEQHDQQVLTATLAAMVLRLCTTSSTDSELEKLIEHYKNVKNNLADQPPAMKFLIDTLGKELSNRLFQPLASEGTLSSQIEVTPLATDALAVWGQMFWKDKEPELDSTLTLEGVISKILEIGNDGQEVKRKLLARVESFRSLDQSSELYLFLPLSHQSERLRQNLALPRLKIINFPDVERLVLLYIQHYIAEPLFIPDSTFVGELPPRQPKVDDAFPPITQPSAERADENPRNLKEGDTIDAGASGQPTNSST